MLKIFKDGAPTLRMRSEPLSEPYPEKDIKLLKEMVDYIIKSQDDDYAEKHKMRAGVGLAAPQVGVNKRMLAIYFQMDDKTISYALINPKIISSSVRLCYLSTGEGCLSVDDDHPGYVYRPHKITIKAYDALQNKNIEIVARGYEAIVLQHEIDHLNGVLYYDHIDKNNPLQRLENSVEI